VRGRYLLAPIDRLEDLLEQVPSRKKSSSIAQHFLPSRRIHETLVLSAAAVFTFASGPLLRRRRAGALERKSCLSCHTSDKKLVGPAYKEVAASTSPERTPKPISRRRSKKARPVWAPSRCRRTDVSDDDAKTLAKYILTSSRRNSQREPRRVKRRLKIDSPVGRPHNQPSFCTAS